MRKLIPALFQRERAGVLPEDGRIIASARSKLSREQYIQSVEDQCAAYVPEDQRKTPLWQHFLTRLHYVAIDANKPEGYADLHALIGQADGKTRVFYLATAPHFFGTICRQLSEVGLVNKKANVVLEKPLGTDLESSRAINAEVAQYFGESQIYRIDHYLGKETVQNLLVLRFGNTLFESLWNQKYIDHIQITVAESVGVEGRAGFYDNAGALRDMVQNHLLQLLCFIAMEPPASLDANAVRDEKLKVLRSLKPLTLDDVKNNVIRGQYTAGAINGKPAPGYRKEEGVDGKSETETFVALKAEIENWRWGKVPFYLRTGKRMAQRVSEIVVQFKAVPHSIFDNRSTGLEPNKLVIKIQPDEDITLFLCGKKPGTGVNVRELELNLTEHAETHIPDAYERLLIDSIVGRQTLFMRRDELDAAWQWVMPILDGWSNGVGRVEPYVAGSWGPSGSAFLLARDNRHWYEDLS
jgi:glucose-6-phosphate 1-dehydrogenase